MKNPKELRTERICRMVEENFTEDDLTMVLSFQENPEDEDTAVREVQRFTRRIRYQARAEGKLFKYVWELERSPMGNFYVRMVLSGGIPIEKLRELWESDMEHARRMKIAKYNRMPPFPREVLKWGKGGTFYV